jgi:hypothetical protein
MKTIAMTRVFGCACACVLAACVLAACGAQVPVDITGVAEADATADATVSVRKYDFLWVIDHSASMARQQRALANAEKSFLAALNANGQIDAQMAVVTVQQVADPPSASGVTVQKIGAFNHTPATSLPSNAMVHFNAPCFVDGPIDASTPSAQCRDGFDFQFVAGKSYDPPATSFLNLDADDPPSDQQGPPYGDILKHYGPFTAAKDLSPTNEWRCTQPGAQSQVTNLNGSVNSTCARHCTADAECQSVFGEPSMSCNVYGGDPSQGRCTFGPPTADCPTADKLPAVLHDADLNLFHCIATVGVSSTPQAGFEGGLRSAWVALDPNGANCPGGQFVLDASGKQQIDATTGKPIANPACQYAQLVRPDATLVIVVVSDDDDCSVDLNLSLANETQDDKKALSELLPKEDWDRCQIFGDATGGNQRLNEGNCMYVKTKKAVPADYKCPADCQPSDAVCLAEAATHVAANRAVDKRFAAVSDFVNKFKGLKSDPAQVIFAAVSGDSRAQMYKDGKVVTDAAGKPVPDEAQKGIESAVYYWAKRQNIASKQTPRICQTTRTSSGYGSRYLDMVHAFGQNGYFGNICDDDLGATLVDFATYLAKKP